MKQYATTIGRIQWDANAIEVESADDPFPPDRIQNWKLVSSTTGELRYSYQPIFWAWECEY